MPKKKDTRPIDYSKPLKNKQWEDFCQFSYKGENATQSAIKAKYSKKTAYSIGPRLLKKVEIARRISFLKAEIAKSLKISVETVVSDIVDTHRRAKEDGDEYTAELKASDMLMKHLGGYEKDNEQHQIVIAETLTEEQLKKRLAEIEAAGNGIDTGSIG
jgi:phage terminase small subunit